MSDTQTFTGRSLEELLPKIREALGEDAVVVARRDVLAGGIGGFFAKRAIELEARPARPRVDVVDEAPAMPPAAEPYAPELVAEDPAPPHGDPFAAALARLQADVPPPAPVEQPVISEHVSEDPRDAESAPPSREDLAAMLANSVIEDEAPVEPAAQPADVAAAAEEPHEPAVAEHDEPATAEPHEPAVAEHDEPATAEQPEPEAVAEPEPLAAAQPEAEAASAAELVPVELRTMAPAAPLPADEVAATPGDVEALVMRGFSPALAEELHTEASQQLPLAGGDLQALLREAIARRIPIATPQRGPGGAVVGFVGPNGAGKTRCVARMATAFATHSEMRVACIALRAEDHGAELMRLLSGVPVTVHAEDDIDAAVARVESLRGSSLVLLDTPGVSPRAEAERRVLTSELSQLKPDELHVCVPATVGAGPARAIAETARQLGASAMAITHADETDDLGGVVELAITGELPVSFLGRGTAVNSGLRPAHADDLALALVP